MKQNDALDKMIDNSFGGALSSFTSPVNPTKKGENRQQVREPAETVVQSRPRHTSAQMRAVAEAQNANRGRGKSKGQRVMVSFKAPKELADAFQDIHFSTGKTLTDLYEEALNYIIKKYNK